MIFAIEVPAESNPLTTGNLHRVLKAATSADQQQLRTSAQQLQNWERQPGYYNSLQVGDMRLDHTAMIALLMLEPVCVCRSLAAH